MKEILRIVAHAVLLLVILILTVLMFRAAEQAKTIAEGYDFASLEYIKYAICQGMKFLLTASSLGGLYNYVGKMTD